MPHTPVSGIKAGLTSRSSGTSLTATEGAIRPDEGVDMEGKHGYLREKVYDQINPCTALLHPYCSNNCIQIQSPRMTCERSTCIFRGRVCPSSGLNGS